MSRFRTPMSQLSSQLYLSGMGAITAENIVRKGITHVLNTAQELRDFQYPTECNLTIKHIVMRDAENENLLKHLDLCVDYVNSICKAGGVILVHCVAGVSRSASVCITYFMKYKKMSLREAYYHVFNKRPSIFPNFGFWRQLAEYELELRGENTVEMMPSVLGFVPDIMKNDVEYRIKFAWMEELYQLFGAHIFILVLQLVAIYVRSYWEENTVK